MAKRKDVVRHVANLIQREVAYFNGWSVSEKSERDSCEKAAAKVLRYLRITPPKPKRRGRKQ